MEALVQAQRDYFFTGATLPCPSAGRPWRGCAGPFSNGRRKFTPPWPPT